MRLKALFSQRLLAGALTALVWALLAGSALWWWLRAAPPPAPPAAVAADAPAGVDGARVAQALGAQAAAPAPAVPDVAGRLKLLGLVAQGGQGAALIAVDGQPARHARVGEAVPGLEGWQVQALTPQGVTLSGGGREFSLQMPSLAERYGPPPS